MNQQSASKLRREELGHRSVQRQHDATYGILQGQQGNMWHDDGDRRHDGGTTTATGGTAKARGSMEQAI